MTLNMLLLDVLNGEVERSRRALREVPDGKYEWKPHERSMKFGYLADMVATIPSWVTMELTSEEFDIAPAAGSNFTMEPKTTSAALVAALDESAAGARKALESASDEHLSANWRLKARGEVVQEAPRYQMILDTLAHWVHHRGQMTVYLRLMGAKVPALYGPSADDTNFR